MFGNYVNRHDLTRLWRRAARGDWRRIQAVLRPGAQQRVEAAWRHVAPTTPQWWSVPGMQARWNRLVSGDPTLDARRWFVRRFLGARAGARPDADPEARSGLVALSAGCGSGARERAWARIGCLQRLDAIDLSATRIEHAVAEARAQKLDGVLRFRVDDIHSLADVGRYDLVIVEQSLHHFAPMEAALGRLRDLLAPGGWLFLDEFVGPDRFQWSDAQLLATDSALARLPEAYRVMPDGRLKTRAIRPSRLAMRLHDPSEAIESSRILPTLRRTFQVESIRGYGGSLLHLLLDGIAHHFQRDDARTRDLLRDCFAWEDELLESGGLPHDFVVACARRA